MKNVFEERIFFLHKAIKYFHENYFLSKFFYYIKNTIIDLMTYMSTFYINNKSYFLCINN